MAASRSTAEEEEVEGEGDGAMEATIVCPAVHFQPKVREGSTEATGVGIRITAAKRVALRADRPLHHIIKGEGMEVSRVEGACCRRVAVEEDSATVAGSTVVAVMAIRITTIKLETLRADRRRACMVKEEGIITEGGSTVKGEG